MLHDEHAMAEMAGGLAEARVDAVADAAAHGVDAGAVVAAEFAAEAQWEPTDDHAAPAVVPTGLAALEAETEE